MPILRWYTPFLKETSQLFSGNWLHWTPFRHERTDTYSGYAWVWVCITAYRALASTLIQGLTEYVTYPNRIPHNLALNTGTHWRVKKKKERTGTAVSIWSYNPLVISHHCHLKAVDLTEWWNSLLKEQLTEKLGDNTLSGSGNTPTGVV